MAVGASARPIGARQCNEYAAEIIQNAVVALKMWFRGRKPNAVHARFEVREQNDASLRFEIIFQIGTWLLSSGPNIET